MGQVYCRAWKSAYAGMFPAKFLDSLTDESCAPAHADPAQNLVAEANGQVVGVVNFGPPREQAAVHVGELRAIYVFPAFWRQGVGKGLLQAALNELKAQGYVGAFLWVLSANERAIRFYEKMGISPIGDERAIHIAGGVFRSASLPALSKGIHFSCHIDHYS